VHIPDRHPGLQGVLGEGAFPRDVGLGLAAAARYLDANDANLNGLANPARISLLTIIAGLVCAACSGCFPRVTA
jgi:hypothetical protein